MEGIQQQFRVMKDVSLGAMSIFTWLLAVLSTAMLLPKDIEDLHLTDERPGPESLVSQQERTVLVQKAVLSLPEASRAVLVLREYEEMSYHEIADALDIPVGTVMSRLNYARKLLKDKLEQELFLQVEAEHV